jgi:hypothetical protein
MPGEVLTMKRKLTEAAIPPSGPAIPGGCFPRPHAGRWTPSHQGSSPVTGKKRRLTIGEHPSGKKGEPRYLTLKQFETDYQILRGKIANEPRNLED